MSDDLAENVKKSAIASIAQGTRLGLSPSKKEIESEVKGLKEKGKTAQEIGESIGAYYVVKKDNETLDKLEEVLTKEFEDYGEGN